jgi:hypothetical protein
MDDSNAAELHSHLEATEELPVDRTAGRWIGEAQAVAKDCMDETMTEEVRRERATEIAELLSHVESMENSDVGHHVERARELADRLSRE